MKIETKDIWQGAYVMSQGAMLEDVRVEGRNGRREVVFILTGQKVEDQSRLFQLGQAQCNVTTLKASLNHLKDVVFSRIRH